MESCIINKQSNEINPRTQNIGQKGSVDPPEIDEQDIARYFYRSAEVAAVADDFSLAV